MDHDTGRILACPNCSSLEIHPLSESYIRSLHKNEPKIYEVYKKLWGKAPSVSNNIFSCDPCKDKYFEVWGNIIGSYPNEDDENEHLGLYLHLTPHSTLEKHEPYTQTPFHRSDCDCSKCDPWQSTEIR
jgi:hypothetical protein